ncbi:MAG: radical SAM protein [Candidatus Zambryskibacteria bacterium CG_4_9_14_3_um_filter_42_9]|nr:MAG: radical SAM protein [Candidatus Zambryskibacteria bacterium CG_4_9_14_3_um_filter_42_9]
MKPLFDSVIIQPTSLCNLNCKYCYLANRDMNRKMAPAVIDRIVDAMKVCRHTFRVTWHGGEPMSSGLEHFQSLVQPMQTLMLRGLVQQVIQTNGTLIDEHWCEFFSRNKFNVGVSIDGPEWANRNRINWSGHESYDKILAGIKFLREANIKFSAICVVTESTITRPEDLYEFFCNLGCFSLGVNLEEKIGINRAMIDSSELVVDFWQRLFRVWRQNPQIEIQSFRRTLSRLEDLSSGSPTAIQRVADKVDLFPSISYCGDVVLLSPEFLDTKSIEYTDFVVGNVLQEPFLDILERCRSIQYVSDFLEGAKKCREICQYFPVCGGGQASNKFFEHGSINTTETDFCRNAYQHLTEVIVSEL